MGKGKLFRQEAVNNVRNKQLGSVCKNTPLPYFGLAICLAIIMLCIISFIIFADFHEKYTVKGYLNTNKGMAQIYPIKNGIITKCNISQGEHIKEGAPLFVINTGYEKVDKELQQQEFKQLQNRDFIIKQEIISKKNNLDNLKPLLLKKYISSVSYQAKQDEITNLENTRHQINMDMIKYKKSLTYTIFSPINGTVTNIMSQVGQYINPVKPLLNILPDNSILIAELYVPTTKSGFISSSDKIVIHLDAYPYHRFGVVCGQIQSISQTILIDSEDSKPIKIGSPYYKIIAKLDKQAISIYGKMRPLQQGMTCSAVIYGVRKKIWQWIFDPLYNFYGELWK